MRAKVEKDGSFTQKKLMHLKSQLNGILGYILHQIELKKFMISKNMNGKNRINLILRGLIKHITQIKIKRMLSIKNIKAGNQNKLFIRLIIFFLISIVTDLKSEDNLVSNKTDIKVLDKISSKNELISLLNGKEYIYKDLAIKSMKCTNSKFDDNPEIKAYIQVRDLTKNDNDKVYVFNGWMFSSSPSIAPFDHPVYDIWLVDCY
jgi:hypothetical protein